MDDEKEDLVDHIQGVLGYLPENTRHILRILAHPQVIEYTQEYFGKLDNKTRCLRYDPPWSCVRESEARYENIKHGWTGAPGPDGGTQDLWCPNCRTDDSMESRAEAIAEALRDESLSEEETARLNSEALHILERQMEEEDEPKDNSSSRAT